MGYFDANTNWLLIYMKAQELLKLYTEGRRNFRGENLRGLSFKGKDLSDADFSKADIRGTNFSRANLTRTKFVGAKAGLQNQWIIGLLIICFLLSVFSGFLITLLSYSAIPRFSDNLANQEIIEAWAGVFVIFGFNFMLICRGFYAAMAAIVAGAFAFGIAGAFNPAFTLALAVVALTLAVFPGTVTVVFVLVGAIGGAFVLAVALAVAISMAFIGDEPNVVIIVASILLILFYTYISRCTINGDSKYIWIRTIAVAFAATGGTTFYNATLTDADFTNTTLKNTDFRKATLIRTCFRKTKQLDLARPGDTYLKTRQIQELVQTGQGQNKNFDRQNLKGVYLKEANLIETSFIETNLQEACLQNANLSNSKLVYTLLDRTDLTGANLTGAYIEGWNITSKTILNDVKCNFVFMCLPPDKRPSCIALPPEETRDCNPCRQPANRNDYFKKGDFADFIAPMKHPLNLYHKKSTDLGLIVLAFEQLVENNPEANIELVSFERKGKDKDKILLRAETTRESDHAVLNAKYSESLVYFQSLTLENIRKLLTEREPIIRLLSGLIDPKHKTSDSYINILQSIDGDLGGVASQNITAVAEDDISGTVTATISQLAKSEALEAPKLAELLKQLQSAIASDTHLSDKDKTKALKQVQALAEAGQNPKDEDKKDLADTAITMLKGIVTGLPVIAASAKACQELLPLITSVFGL